MDTSSTGVRVLDLEAQTGVQPSCCILVLVPLSGYGTSAMYRSSSLQQDIKPGRARAASGRGRSAAGVTVRRRPVTEHTVTQMVVVATHAVTLVSELMSATKLGHPEAMGLD